VERTFVKFDEYQIFEKVVMCKKVSRIQFVSNFLKKFKKYLIKKEKQGKKRKLYRTKKSLGETFKFFFFEKSVKIGIKRKHYYCHDQVQECKSRVSFHKHVLEKERKKKKNSKGNKSNSIDFAR